MPNCRVCGLKVERGQDKLQCIICKQYMHLNCCNLSKNEFLAVKSAYKCNCCVNARRSSLPATPANIAANKVAVSSAAIVSSPSCAKCATCSGDLSDKSKEVDTDVSCAATVAILCKEIASLRHSNDLMSATLSSLCADNANLIKKVTDLNLTVLSFQNITQHKQKSTTKQSIKKNVNKVQSSAGTTATNSNSDDLISLDNLLVSDVIVDANNVNDVTNEIDDANKVNDETNGIAAAGGLPATISGAGVPSYAHIAKSSGKRKTVKPTVIGESANSELCVFRKKKWLHLSSFKSSVTAESIVNYVNVHTGIEKSHIECYKLVKKDADINVLKFINFKLGIFPDHYDKVFTASLWPEAITVRPFRFDVELQSFGTVFITN